MKKTIIILIAILLLNCAHCFYTDSYAEVKHAEKIGAKVSQNKYGVYKVCLKRKDID